MSNLADKTAIITGSAGGIGRGVALRLAHDGANVIVNDLGDSSRADAVVQEIRDDGGTAIAVMADITRSEDRHRLVEETVKEFGKIDILMNNAGAPLGGSLLDVDEEVWDKSLGVNLKGAFFLTQAVVPHMPGQEGDEPGTGGRIIMVSSSTVAFPMAGTSPYVASKSGQRGLTEVLALELGPRGISVNTVLPGPTMPGMFSAAPPQMQEHAASLSPFNRIGRPEDIAGVVAFLASEDSRWITGQHFLVNGGATI